MLILMITTNDPAGSAFNLMQAVNRSTMHTCRLVTTETRYNFLYRKDLHLPLMNDYSELEHLLKTCDVMHFHMSTDENMHLGPFMIGAYIKGKKIIHHHHGEPSFRSSPDTFRNKELKSGRTALVSTPDLKLLYPEARWLPNTVPLHDTLYMPAGVERDRPIITHSPTRKDLKNTDEFVVTVMSLVAEGFNLSYKVIERTPHEIALRAKRASDICFDHMHGYYGMSSIEALSQGVVAIAGLSNHTISLINEFTGTDANPWIIARDKNELRQKLIELLDDRDLLRNYKSFSRDWMLKYWSEGIIAKLYINLIS